MDLTKSEKLENYKDYAKAIIKTDNEPISFEQFEDYIAQLVDIIASGYEWICPICEKFNKEIDYSQFVTCSECNTDFETNPPEHCYAH